MVAALRVGVSCEVLVKGAAFVAVVSVALLDTDVVAPVLAVEPDV
jgi:hypothetical protein